MNSMKLINYLSILALFVSTQLSCQLANDPISKLRNNAIPIDSLSDLDGRIYEEIKNYEVIMMGEMHGTNEPAAFVLGLAKLISKKEGKVVLAMEIQSSEIDIYGKKITTENLLKTKLFTRENIDGRNGQAWFNLIAEASRVNGLSIVYIDNNTVQPRDSSMYLDVKYCKETFPNTKIITLTGNIHNILKPYVGEHKLGSYLMNDTVLFNPQKIMSINHMYKSGTMMNSNGKGIELRTVEGKDSFLNKTIATKKYLCKNIFESQNNYTHFLYTESVSHSDKVRK